MGILRGIESDDIEPLAETISASGLGSVEITLNTSGASDLIKKMIKASEGRFFVGAGTVLNIDGLKKALDAGATFIVSPVCVPEVVEYCSNHKIPVFPGALTPAEIYQAWNMGATMVKVFPSNFFGPEYFKEIKGPFDQIKLLACGGVTAENLKSYFTFGASGAAFGASIFRHDWLEEKKFKSIQFEIQRLLRALP